MTAGLVSAFIHHGTWRGQKTIARRLKIVLFAAFLFINGVELSNHYFPYRTYSRQYTENNELIIVFIACNERAQTGGMTNDNTIYERRI